MAQVKDISLGGKSYRRSAFHCCISIMVPAAIVEVLERDFATYGRTVRMVGLRLQYRYLSRMA